MLRHARRGKLVRNEQQRRENEYAAETDHGEAQVRGGAARDRARGATGARRRGSLGWRCTHHLKPSDEYDVVLVNAVESLDLQADPGRPTWASSSPAVQGGGFLVEAGGPRRPDARVSAAHDWQTAGSVAQSL